MITILDIAKHRGVKVEGDGSVRGDAFEAVDLPIMAGCECCGATLGAFNAYPTDSGYIRCHEDAQEALGLSKSMGVGFSTVEAFEAFIDAGMIDICPACDAGDPTNIEPDHALRDCPVADSLD